jgi:heptaprenyl diphosphate synthase
MLTPRHGREYRQNRHSLALLGSLCLFLSAVEYLIPKPLPFMRIGLANMPLLLALDIFTPGDFFCLALLKILGQGLVGGMFFSHVFLFSMAGTLSSALVMFALSRLPRKTRPGFAGIGCAGAMASNCLQLLLARYLIFGPALRYLITPFLASGLFTGVGLGLICEYFCRHSAWYANVSSNISRRGGEFTNSALSSASLAPLTEGAPRRRGRSFWNDFFNAELLCIAGLLMALIFLFNRSFQIRIAQFIFFCLLTFIFGKRINLFAAVFFTGSIVFFHLLAPFGKVLAVFGPLRITQGGLSAGIEKAVTVSGLVILSRVCIRSDLRLPGTIGLLLGDSLRMLELLRERRGMIRRKRIISGLDQLLLEIEEIIPDDPPNTPMKKQAINVRSILLLILMVIITAGMNLIPRF